MQLTIEQKQQLSQAQMQSLQVLALGALELEGFCREEELENPLLELDGADGRFEQLVQETGWLNDQERRFDDRAEWPGDDEPPSREPAQEEAPDLAGYLLSQVNERKLAPGLYPALCVLAAMLDGRGYLPVPASQLPAVLHCPPAQAGRAAALLRSLEPAGVGAYDLPDCLLLQLARREGQAARDAEALVRDHLDDLAHSSLRSLGRALHLPAERMQAALALLQTLSPRPAAPFGGGAAQYITPDLIARYEDGAWEVEINDRWFGTLRVSQSYLALARQAATPEEKQYFAAKLGRARAILGAIEQRRSTLEALARYLLEYQQAFVLENAPRRPLSQQQVAAALGVHASTVSRALQDKYIQCPRGTFPLRDLLERGLCAAGEGARSADAAKRALQQLIAEEPPDAPLNDQQMAEALAAGLGLQISRRTVAKYRAELGIGGVHDRRRPG